MLVISLLFLLACVGLILGTYATWKVSEIPVLKPGSGSGSGSSAYATKADIDAAMKKNGIWCAADGSCIVPRPLDLGTNMLKIGQFDVSNTGGSAGNALTFVNREKPNAPLKINSYNNSSIGLKTAAGLDKWLE